MSVDLPTSLFTIRLSGRGVRPGLVPAGDLAELLVAAEQMVTAIVRRDHPELSEDLVVGLSELRDESISFGFVANEPEIVGAAYRELIVALENRDFGGLPSRCLDSVRVLTTFTRDRQGATELWNGSQTVPWLVLESDFILEVPRPQYFRGETTIFGKVERVGGVRPRVRLRISAQEIVHADLDEELARAVGKRLYKHVALCGQATWDERDGTIVYFRAEELQTYEPAPARQVFQELQRAANGAFDQIEDIDNFAQRIREGDLP